MPDTRRSRSIPFGLLLGPALALSCSTEGGTGGAQGGAAGRGGSATGQGGSPSDVTGGSSAPGTGGSNGSSGNTATGGTVAASGGTASGGVIVSGGASSGGAASGGVGQAVGGAPNRGGSAGAGLAGAAGAGNGGNGAGGVSLRPSFYLGADITDQESAPLATRANLLNLMKSHGFNSIRLRTFVDPKAADGYDKNNGYADIAHTVDFGKQIKEAGMSLLIDFHYSDNWADPGKQCVPIAWQGYATIGELATALHDYTKDAITKLIAGGARPDMVQIGNEITPGMLLHRCDGDGQPTGNNAVTGSTSNWANLGMLLKAGVQGVKDVDPSILISFHIDRGGDKPSDDAGAALETSIYWITNALKYTLFDAFGESSYQKYQGDPNSAANTKATWTSTFGGLASKYPEIKFFSAEYGPMQREINDVLFSLPNQQGIGTFNWEPTTQGDWNSGHDLLRRSGSNYTAQPDLALYDQMKVDYATRL